MAIRTAGRQFHLLGSGLPVIAGISIAVVILVLMHVTGLGFYEVEGDSMSPAFQSGDLVLVRSTGGHADRGDVVIVSPPDGSPNFFMKRIIAESGDTIELRDGKVILNGAVLDEPYLAAGIATDPAADDRERWRVDPGRLFVLGDNRGASQDSRWYGLFDAAHVAGTPVFRYWPLDRLGFVATP